MKHQVCNFCVMDTTDPDIIFDEAGQCNYCKSYLENLPKLPRYQSDASEQLNKIIQKIKDDGKGKPYDCIIGLSGGVDSTYVAYLVKEVFALRPLAVHMDNGWNSELSIKNVENIVKKLGIDLYTKILDWEEFRDLQLAFLKASTPDSEIPTDHAIFATVREVAKKKDIKHIISGQNFLTERIMAHAWSQGHYDLRYIRAIYKKFTGKNLKNFPVLSKFKNYLYSNISYTWILDYYAFDLKEAKKIIETKFDWKEYGGKHYESVYTKFFQGYILPTKFGFDKRKGHLSNLICCAVLKRDEAVKILSTDAIDKNEVTYLKAYVAKKLKIFPEELEDILSAPPKTYYDYPNQYNTVWYIYSRKYLKPFYVMLKRVLGK